MSLSEILKELRNKSGLSQQDLAEDIGLSKSSISMYEAGEREPSIDVAKRLADYFDVTVDYLLGYGNSFKDRLKSLRNENGISQTNLANKVGLSKSTIGAYETGDIAPSIAALDILADFFKVDVAYLLGKSDIKRLPDVIETAKLLENDEELLALIKRAKDPIFRSKLLQIAALIGD